MRMLLLFSLGALFALPSTPVRAAPLTDPATALPEQTIVYAEVHDPGKLVAQLDSLFKGSALENMPASLVRFEERHGQAPVTFGPPKEALGVLGLLLSPDVAREMQRFGGAAVGLTGLSRHGEPDYVVLLLPGRSTLPGMAFRSAVMMMPTVAAGNVDGVMLYRPARDHSSSAPVFARTSAAILIGSQDAVMQTLHRIQGKVGGKSLADSEPFRQARAQAGSEPGLFGYVNIPELGDVLARRMVGHEGRAQQALVRQILNPAAFRYEVLSFTLTNGALRYRQIVALDAKEQSPALAILPNRPADIELLHFAPKNAVAAGVLSNADGQKRWAAGLKLVDQIAQAHGQAEPLPSEQLKQAEAALGIDVGKDIMARIANAGAAVGNPFQSGQNGKPHLVGTPPLLFIIQGHSADDAMKLLEEVAPKILNAINHGEGNEPASETVAGRTLHRVKVGQLDLHYGRDEAVIVIGMDGTLVASALAAGAKKQGYLADNQIRAAVARFGHSFALLVARPVPVLASIFFGRARPAQRPARRTSPAPSSVSPQPRSQSRLNQENIVRVAHVSADDMDGPPRWQQMMQQFNQFGPLVVSWDRTPEHLTITAELTGLKPGVARLTNWLLEQYFQAGAGRQPGQRRPPVPEHRPAQPGLR